MSYNPPAAAAADAADPAASQGMSTGAKVALAAGGVAAAVGALAVGAAVVGGSGYLVYQTVEAHNQNKQPHKVHVLMMSASNLKAADRGNTSDPYVEISTDKCAVKTKSQSNTLNPQWNEEFTYGVHEEQIATESIKFTVMDKDRFGKDDHIGTVEVPLSQLTAQPRDFQLKLERVDTGVLNCRLWLTHEPEQS